MNNKWKSNHHRIAKSRAKDGFDVNHPDNQWLIDHKLHDNVHRLFHNKLPHEQILFLLDLNAQVIQRTSAKVLIDVLNDDNFYKKHLKKDL